VFKLQRTAKNGSHERQVCSYLWGGDLRGRRRERVHLRCGGGVWGAGMFCFFYWAVVNRVKIYINLSGVKWHFVSFSQWERGTIWVCLKADGCETRVQIYYFTK
jgi:hypothetical protein